MLLWFKHLPKISMNLEGWTPFIQNDWFRKHFMKFVYALQIMIFLVASYFYKWFSSFDGFVLVLIGIIVFIVHECLHIIVVIKQGNISLTFSGFFWLHTDAVLSKTRFWIFMSLPFIALTLIPALASFFVSGDLKSIVLFVSVLNLWISSADIINSFLIAMKPKNAIFYRGYYRVVPSELGD